MWAAKHVFGVMAHVCHHRNNSFMLILYFFSLQRGVCREVIDLTGDVQQIENSMNIVRIRPGIYIGVLSAGGLADR